MMAIPEPPRCWKCGFELSGIRVDGVCSECGTPIWSRPGLDPVLLRNAKLATGWGVASIVLFFVCLGPLAGFVGIPAVVFGSRVRRAITAGEVDPAQAGGARLGFWLGWITIGLSILSVVGYIVFALFVMFLPLLSLGAWP